MREVTCYATLQATYWNKRMNTVKVVRLTQGRPHNRPHNVDGPVVKLKLSVPESIFEPYEVEADVIVDTGKAAAHRTRSGGRIGGSRVTAPDPTTPRCPTCGDVVPTTTGMECIGGKHIWHGGHTESLEVGEVRQFSDPRPADVPDPLGLEVGGTERHEWSAEVHADVLVSALRVERDAAQAELAQAREALRGWLELHSRRHMQADIFRMSDKTHRALADGEAPMEVHACPKCLHAYHPDGHCLHVVASTPPIFCGCLADGEERE